MAMPFGITVGWLELIKRTLKESLADNCLGLAAQLAYYFFLALFPALLFLVAIVSFVPVAGLLDAITSNLARVAPTEVLSIIQELARDGLTMLIATHEMGLARQIASRVYFVEAGLIADEGTPHEIFDNPQKPRTREFLRAVVH